MDLYFFEGGYCGVQPVVVADEVAGRVNASAMVRADVASTLPEVFARHPALRERSRNWRWLSRPVSTSPLIFRQPEPERDGILRVGDAAGFVDPFVGDGISLALRGGALAAHCLASFFSGEASLHEAARSYSRAYEQSLLPVFRASSALRRMLVLPFPVRKPLLFFLERTQRLPSTWCARPAEECGRERPRSCSAIKNEWLRLSEWFASLPLRARRPLAAGNASRADRRMPALQNAVSGRPGLRGRCRGRERILWKRNRGRDFRCCGC